MKSFSFKDTEGTSLSIHINEQYSTASIGVTDSGGRSTNAINVPWKRAKKMLQDIIDEIDNLEEQEIKDESRR